MKDTKFLRKNWLTIGLLAFTLVGANWIVRHERAPGSMSLTEAQGMDMSDMKAPVGNTPVAVELVEPRSLSGGTSFPGTVMPLQEENIVARIPGQVNSILVYPGDKVVAGQLVATISAPEYDAQLQKAEANARTIQENALTSGQRVSQSENKSKGDNSSIEVAKAAVLGAKTDYQTALLQNQKSEKDLEIVKSSVAAQQSALTFSQQYLSREKVLYQEGAIALEELQAAQKDATSNQAVVAQAMSSVASAKKQLEITKNQINNAVHMLHAANAQLESAKANYASSQNGVQIAESESQASRFEVGTAQADVTNAATFSDYRRLTALSSGTVSARIINAGTSVSAGQTILTITSIDMVRVQADIAENLANRTQVGEPIFIQVDGKKVEAKLTSVFPTVDMATRTFKVESILPNPNGELKSGMYVNVELDSSKNGAHLAVKDASVQSEGSMHFVWKIGTKQGTGKTDWTCTMHPDVSEKGPGKCPKCGMDLVPRERGGSMIALRVPVDIGKSANGYTEILSGLKAGDKVIWAGLDSLVEGSSVAPTSWGDNGPIKNPDPDSENSQQMQNMPGMSGMSDMAGMNKTPDRFHENMNSSHPDSTPLPAKTVNSANSEPKPPVMDPKMPGMSMPNHSTKTTKKVIRNLTKVVFVCPMDKDVVSDKPGKCPKCGMTLVKKVISNPVSKP